MDWICDSKSPAFVLRLESLVCILDVEASEEPRSTGDHFKIKLTQESASALAKVEELELWTVGHTMVRGDQKVLGGEVEFSGGKKSLPTLKGRRKRKTDDGPDNPEQIWQMDLIGRNSAGRQALQRMLQHLQAKDEMAFASAPMFGLDGHCRLKLPQANEFTWNQLLKAGPEAIECVYLGLIQHQRL